MGGEESGKTNGRGGRKAPKPKKSRKTMRNLTRIHQEPPELTQEAPQMPRDLAEPLFNPFRQHSFATKQRARARARSTIHSWEPQPRDHHRLTPTHSFASPRPPARTHERNETISRLGSLPFFPPNLQSIYLYIGGRNSYRMPCRADFDNPL